MYSHVDNGRLKTATIVLAGAFAFAAMGATAPARAAAEARTERVPYADLNLASQSGLKRLQTRVKMAAKRVCGVRERITLRAAGASRSCYAKTVARADRDIDIAAARMVGDTRLAAR